MHFLIYDRLNPIVIAESGILLFILPEHESYMNVC